MTGPTNFAKPERGGAEANYAKTSSKGRNLVALGQSSIAINFGADEYPPNLDKRCWQ